MYRRITSGGWAYALSVQAARRWSASLLASLLALCAAAACTPSLAGAARGHDSAFVVPFGGPGSGAGQLELAWASNNFTALSGLAINETTHDVYVADTGNRRIDEFSSSGTFLRAWGWGVETGAAELQVCTTTCQQGLFGSGPGELEKPAFMAVDNDPSSPSFEDVYVGDAEDDLVTKFDKEGHLISTWGNNGSASEPNGQLKGRTSPEELFSGGFAEQALAGVGVDESGNLWVYGHDRHLFEFTQGGSFMTTCIPPVEGGAGSKGIALAPGALYLVDGVGSVQRLLNGQCSSSPVVTASTRAASGLAFDGFNSQLYVDGAGELIEALPSACVLSGTKCKPLQVFGEGPLAEAVGIVVNPESGAIYVANTSTNQILKFPLAVEATASSPEAVTAHSLTLRGEVNPVGAELTHCEFEYGTTESYGSLTNCKESLAAIGSGSSPVTVHADLEGLNGGTTYHYRLRAANAHGNVRSEDVHFETLKTALIKGVSAPQEDLTGTTALLKAVVNPEGVANTTYQFEYGRCTNLRACPTEGYETTVPEPAQGIPTSSTEEEVTQAISGLSPGNIYHFRVVVKDANGEATPSPEGTFVFAPGQPACATPRPQPLVHGLPDCRSYELVTPPFKNGTLVDNGAFLPLPAFSRDGEKVVSVSIQCFYEPTSCTGIRQSEGEPYAFERTSTGWVTKPMAPPESFTGTTTLAFNADNGLSIFAAPPSEGQPEEIYLRQSDGALSAVGPISEKPGAVVGFVVSSTLLGTSDYSHIAYNGFEFWGFDESNFHGAIYEYPGVSGHPVLANVTGEEKDSRSLIGVCGADIGGSKLPHNGFHTLSSDGRTLIFTVEPCATGSGLNEGKATPAHRVYERIEREDGTMITREVSESGAESVCSKACREQPEADASFEGASADGTRVYFTDTRQLTDNSNEDRRAGETAYRGCTRTASDTSGCNLYLWECPHHCEHPETDERLVDVSAGDTSGLGPQVQGVVAIAEDGSSVYFVARGVLAGANPAGTAPAPGAENLYVWGPDKTGKVRTAFIGTLAVADHSLWDSGVGVANLTPDGRYLVFASQRALTPDVSRAEGPAQIYRYDAQTEELVRVSIGQQGFDDNGNAGTGDARIIHSVFGFVVSGRADPSMSDDGQFVFFESPVGLAPGALNDAHVTGNEKVLSENIYEWEAPGARPSANAPACEQQGGCVWLISDGRDRTEGSDVHQNESAVQLLGSDSSGHNVFFETADQLVAGDTDSQVDFYDARVNGGFPAQAETLPCGSLGECHEPPPAEEPVFGGGATLSAGLGNFVGPPQEEGTSAPKPLVVHLTPAQVLARALTTCRNKPAGQARIACERAARLRYREQLLVKALAACRRRVGKARATCVRRAHARYGKSVRAGRTGR